MVNITAKEMVKLAKRDLEELSVDDVKSMLKLNNVHIIDLRDTS